MDSIARWAKEALAEVPIWIVSHYVIRNHQRRFVIIKYECLYIYIYICTLSLIIISGCISTIYIYYNYALWLFNIAMETTTDL